MKNKHIGSDFDDFLREENLLEDAEAIATKRAKSVREERGGSFLRFLEEEVWPTAPSGQLCRRLTREEEEKILGYGPEGV